MLALPHPTSCQSHLQSPASYRRGELAFARKRHPGRFRLRPTQARGASRGNAIGLRESGAYSLACASGFCERTPALPLVCWLSHTRLHVNLTYSRRPPAGGANLLSRENAILTVFAPPPPRPDTRAKGMRTASENVTRIPSLPFRAFVNEPLPSPRCHPSRLTALPPPTESMNNPAGFVRLTFAFQAALESCSSPLLNS